MARSSAPRALASSVAGASAIGSAVTHRPGPGADDAGAEPGSARGADDEGLGAAGQRAGGLDAGEGADAGEAVAHLGDEQQLAPGVGGGLGGGLGLVGLGGDRHHHAGQDHAVGKGQGGEGVGVDRAGHGDLQEVTCDVQVTTT